MVRENIRNLDWQSLLRRISELTSRALHPMSVNPDDANLVEYIQFCNFLQYKIAKDGVIPVDEFIVMLAKSVDSDNIAENESKYKNITTSNYKFELRFSDHYINCWNFSVINRSSDFGYSIVIKKRNLRRRTRFIPKENANYVEFVYFEDSITADLQIAIIEGLKQILLKNDISAMPLVGRMHFSGIYNQEFGKNWELADTTTNGLGAYEPEKEVSSFKPRFQVGDWICLDTLRSKPVNSYRIVQVLSVLENRVTQVISYNLSDSILGDDKIIDEYIPKDKGFVRKSNMPYTLYKQNKLVSAIKPKFKIGDEVVIKWEDGFKRGDLVKHYCISGDSQLGNLHVEYSFVGGYSMYEDGCEPVKGGMTLSLLKESELVGLTSKKHLNEIYAFTDYPKPKFNIGDYVTLEKPIYTDDSLNNRIYIVQAINWTGSQWEIFVGTWNYESKFKLMESATETTKYKIGDSVSVVGTKDTGVIRRIVTDWNDKDTAITHVSYTINDGKMDIWEVGNDDCLKISDSSKSDTTTNGLGATGFQIGEWVKCIYKDSEGHQRYYIFPIEGFSEGKIIAYGTWSKSNVHKFTQPKFKIGDYVSVDDDDYALPVYGTITRVRYDISDKRYEYQVDTAKGDWLVPENKIAKEFNSVIIAKSDTSLATKELDLIKADLNLPQPKFKVGDWVSPIGSELMKDMPAFEYYMVVGISLGWDNTPQYSTSYNRIFRENELRKEKITIVPKFQIGDDIQTKYKGNIVRAKCGGFRYVARNQKIFYTFKDFIMPDIAENKIAAVSDDSGNIKVGDWVRCPDAAFPDNAEQVLKIHPNGEVETSDRHDLTNLSMWKMEDLKKTGSSFTPKFKIGDNVVTASEKDQILTIKDYYVNTRNYDVMYRSVGSDDKRWHLNRESDIELWKHDYEPNSKFNKIASGNFDFDPNDSFYSRFLGAITEEGADGLLQATNYDTKHKLNLAPDKRIPESVVEDLRKEGLTIEKIDALAKDGYPVCKYKTQVTIHGICPTLKGNRSAGGYVTLVVNDNKSLGVRWRAIDEKKKYDIVRILGWFGYRYKEDSQNFVITRSIPALRNPKDQHSNMSKEEEEAKYKELQATFQKLIDNNLFFGEVRIGKPTHSWFISNYFHVVINIDGIYEKNIKPFIETILGMKYSDVEAEIARMKNEAEEEEKSEEEQRKREAAERAKKQAEQAAEIERQRELLPFPPEFKKVDELKKDDIIVFWKTIFHPEIKVELQYHKVYSAYGKLRCYFCDENGVVTDKSGHDIPAKQKDNAWYVKRATAQAKPQREVKSVAIDSSEATDFKILRYSDKAYILTGNTKPYAAILGRKGGMGLKWGTYWKNSQYDPIPNGTGWMFGEQLKPKVEEFIAKYQKTESKPEKPEETANEPTPEPENNWKHGDWISDRPFRAVRIIFKDKNGCVLSDDTYLPASKYGPYHKVDCNLKNQFFSNTFAYIRENDKFVEVKILGYFSVPNYTEVIYQVEKKNGDRIYSYPEDKLISADLKLFELNLLK